MPTQRTYLVGIIVSIVVAYVYNFGFFFFAYSLWQEKSVAQFTAAETLKLSNGLIWFLYVIAVGFLAFWGHVATQNQWSKKNRLRYNLPVITLIFDIIMVGLVTVLGVILFQLLPGSLHDLSVGTLFYKNLFFVTPSLIAALIVSANLKNKLRDSELIQLRQEKSMAELQALREQVSPHFLFNTLNSLMAVIRTQDKENSLAFVENMSQVYRYIIESEQRNLVTVREEIEFLNAYFYLLKRRFGNNLHLTTQLDEVVLIKQIPPMTLQLLLENVVKHNKLTKAHPIQVTLTNDGNVLRFKNTRNRKEVADSFGRGLGNLQRRLTLLAGQELSVQETDQFFTVLLPAL